MLRVLTSTQMTHFSISKGLRMGGKKIERRERRGGGNLKREGRQQCGANHVNLKQATNPGGFLFLCGAMPYCHLFFHFSAALAVVIELILPLFLLHVYAQLIYSALLFTFRVSVSCRVWTSPLFPP